MNKTIFKLLSHRHLLLDSLRTAVRDVQNAEKTEAPESFDMAVVVVDECRGALLQVSKFIDDAEARFNHESEMNDNDELRWQLAEAVEDFQEQKERADSLESELADLRERSVKYNEAAEQDFDSKIHVIQQALNTEKFNHKEQLHRLTQEKELLKDELNDLNWTLKQRNKLLETIEGENIRLASESDLIKAKNKALTEKASELQDEVDILSATIDISSKKTAKAA